MCALTTGEFVAVGLKRTIVLSDDDGLPMGLTWQQLSSAGIVLAPEFFVREHLSRRRLVPVLQEWTQAGVPIFAVTPPGGLLAPKVRVFVELLAAHFEQETSRRVSGAKP